MSKTIKRIELPSGDWWEIETRPRWKHAQECEDETERDILEHTLANLTTAWSFSDEISRASVKERTDEERRAVLEALNVGLSQFAYKDSHREQSEELFVGLVTGQIPSHFAEAHIMAATGWSWQTLQDTPADVVQKMMMYLSVRQARDSNGSLDLNDDEGAQHDE